VTIIIETSLVTRPDATQTD